MNLFDLFATISLDTSEYYGEVKRASKSGDSLSKNFKEIKKNADRMESSMDDTADSLDDVADAADDAEKNIDDVGDTMKKTGKSSGGLINGLADIKAGFDGIVGIISGVIDSVAGAVEAFFELADSTEEYRIAQGKLHTAFETAGYDVETATQAYTEFYKILGDTDTATEASQLLAKLADDADDVSYWTNIAAGIYGTFGDSLPIEGLIEAANETEKVGQVTGTLADALNWAGINEDDFNEKLADCSTESERNQLIMDTLSETYGEASDAFYRNNEELVKARENQALMDESMGELGETVQKLKNQIAEDFTPALSGVVTAFSDVVKGADGAKEDLSEKITELIDTFGEKLPEYNDLGANIVEAIGFGIIDNSDELVDALEEGYERNQEAMQDLAKSFFKKIGESIVDGVEEGFLEKWSRFTSNLGSSYGPIGNVVNTVKRVLGINSPSKVFSEIGKNMALGLSDGWENEYSHIFRTIGDEMNFGTAHVDFASSGLGVASVGMVNGISSAIQDTGGTGAYTFNLLFPDYTKLASYTFQPMVDYAKANGTPILTPT